MSSTLVLAQARVDKLLSVQNQLRVLLGGSPSEVSGNLPSKKEAELRLLLGRVVRQQTDQQLEIESLRAALREEKTTSLNAKAAAQAAEEEKEQLRTAADQLREELKNERTERMESEAAAMEREEQLQEKVEELEEAERRRIEIEKAMAEAEPPPSNPAPSIQIQAPPPPQPAAGFDVGAGGFSL